MLKAIHKAQTFLSLSAVSPLFSTWKDAIQLKAEMFSQFMSDNSPGLLTWSCSIGPLERQDRLWFSSERSQWWGAQQGGPYTLLDTASLCLGIFGLVSPNKAIDLVWHEILMLNLEKFSNIIMIPHEEFMDFPVLLVQVNSPLRRC